MNDRLASLMSHFRLSAEVFHNGSLCSQVDFDAHHGIGTLHVLNAGTLQLDATLTAGHARWNMTEPHLIFFPVPTPHTLTPDHAVQTDLVCANINFGISKENPVLQALPNPLVIPLSAIPALAQLLDVMFSEAFSEHCGQEAALNRLTEVLVIHILRFLMNQNTEKMGLLAGMADERLNRAITAIHDKPDHPWCLTSLAEEALMSRSRFAVTFKATVGMTAGDYLSQWRLGLAQHWLRQGKPVGWVAQEVGYSNANSFARAFAAHCGASPLAWLKQQ